MPPYGYAAERHPHPNPLKASQGRTKTCLVINPARKPVVEAIYRWRTVKKLSVPAVTGRLHADPAAYPPPDGGRTDATVYGILGNPNYIGHQVFGRRRTRDGRRCHAPADQWLWTPEEVHEPIISVDTWKAAQDIGAEHASSHDNGDPSRTWPGLYPHRSRVRCRDCQKRMSANPFLKSRVLPLPAQPSPLGRLPHSPAQCFTAPAPPGPLRVAYIRHCVR